MEHSSLGQSFIAGYEVTNLQSVCTGHSVSGWVTLLVFIMVSGK